MSLTTAENGAVTLSKALHHVCLEAVWELEALANVLLAALSDYAEAVSDLERSVHVTPMRADQTITEK